MAYLIDSDVAILDLDDDADTIALLERLAAAGISISVITCMEIYQGTLLTPIPRVSAERFAAFIEKMPIAPFSVSTARRCAWLRETLSGRGRRVRAQMLDLIIAATALEHGLILVTHNVSDYSDIPDLMLHSFE